MLTRFAILKVLTNQRRSKRIMRMLRGPFSQLEMAKITGIRYQHIYRLENLLVKPHAATIRKLVDHFLRWTTKYRIDPLDALTLSKKAIEELERKRKEGK